MLLCVRQDHPEHDCCVNLEEGDVRVVFWSSTKPGRSTCRPALDRSTESSTSGQLVTAGVGILAALRARGLRSGSMVTAGPRWDQRTWSVRSTSWD